MKKNKKLFLIIILSLVCVFIITFTIDFSRVKNNKPPLLSINIKEKWFGFGYVITKCPEISTDPSSDDNDDNKYKIKLYFIKTVCVASYDIEIKAEEKYKVIDESNVCRTALEEIHKDDLYTYFLKCIKSKKIFLKYDNGNKIPLMEAIDEKKIPISELIDNGLEIVKKEI